MGDKVTKYAQPLCLHHLVTHSPCQLVIPGLLDIANSSTVRTDMRGNRPTPARTAFTVIELLIAMGIIVILGSILILGLKGITQKTKGSSAQVMLQNASGLLAELDAVGK